MIMIVSQSDPRPKVEFCLSSYSYLAFRSRSGDGPI